MRTSSPADLTSHGNLSVLYRLGLGATDSDYLKGLAMFVLLLSLLLAEETNEILDTLSPMEIKQIDELPDDERRYVLNRITNGTLPTRRDWFTLHTDEMFFAPGGIKIDQIVDESNFIGDNGSVWVEGVNTAGLSDDDALKTEGKMFLCVGNKQYTTVLGGSKTVMKIVRVNPKDSLPLLRELAEPRGYRVWGEGSQQLVLAKHMSSSSRTVRIEPLSGKRTEIKKSLLTKVDLKWVTEQEVAKRKAKEQKDQ